MADPPLSRFMSHVEKTETCWLWTGAVLPNGYGYVSVGHPQTDYAHRVAYRLMVGAIPPGLTIDHVKAAGCTHKNCVNPDHLEPVTQAENSRRGGSPAAVNARKTHCNNGHEFTEENTAVNKKGHRRCRTCRREWERRHRRDAVGITEANCEANQGEGRLRLSPDPRSVG